MILALIVQKKAKEEASKQEQTNAAVGFRAVYVFDQMDTNGKADELGSADGDLSGYTSHPHSPCKLRFSFTSERKAQTGDNGYVFSVRR